MTTASNCGGGGRLGDVGVGAAYTGGSAAHTRGGALYS